MDINQEMKYRLLKEENEKLKAKVKFLNNLIKMMESSRDREREHNRGY